MNGYSFDHPHVERMTATMPIMGKRIFVPLGSRASCPVDSPSDFSVFSRLKRVGGEKVLQFGEPWARDLGWRESVPPSWWTQVGFV